MQDYIRLYCGSELAGNVILPSIALIDTNQRIRGVNYWESWETADDLITKINQFADTGYETPDPYRGGDADLVIRGTEDYVSAKNIVRLVNQARERNGHEPLFFDRALTETAMRRAEEIAVYYSH